MEIFSRLVHERGKTTYEKDFVESDPSTWPKEWVTTYYKEYTRFPEFMLPETNNQFDLYQAIGKRRSDRDPSGAGLSLNELSALLRYSCGQFKEPSKDNPGGYRAQPSGGGRFPIEMYVLLFASADPTLKPGVYHYNVKRHSLSYLWDGGEIFANKSLIMKNPWTEKASALLVMTGIFWRNQNKYQARGYRMINIEVGAIIQNLYLLAQALALKCVAYAGTNDDKIEELLDLDTDVESLMMSVVVGK